MNSKEKLNTLRLIAQRHGLIIGVIRNSGSESYRCMIIDAVTNAVLVPYFLTIDGVEAYLAELEQATKN